MDPEQKMRMQELQREIMETSKSLISIRPILVEATQKLKKGEKFSAEQMQHIQSLAISNKRMTEQLEEDQREFDALEKLMQGQSKACVCVSEEAYSGTTISIGDASMVLKSNMNYCRFIKEKGSIKSVPY